MIAGNISNDIKKEISYAESLCRELENKVQALEKKLEQYDDTSQQIEQTTKKKQFLTTELKEMQKLLKKHTEQLEHLRTHNSAPLKLVMLVTLVIFITWMIVVLLYNWGKSDMVLKTEGKI